MPEMSLDVRTNVHRAAGAVMSLRTSKHRPAVSTDHPLAHHSPASPKYQKKVETVMGEYKAGTLKSGSGGKVTKKSQAVAIALSEARKARKT